MTREELTTFIKNTKGKWCFTTESGKEVSEDDVIKALEQEPCDDAISRQTVLDMMQMKMGGKELYKAVYDLPSVQPKTDILDKIKTEINKLSPEPTAEDVIDGNEVKDAIWAILIEVDKIIDKYKEG